ncbi:MAG: AmmeMemoRadiSam system protein B, partial [Planctomycetes bacterium]|nr:AmmeMemoRadiSam system protein B [Planctomycetota bacterium]
MKIREPVVAGQFYPERESECRRDVVRLLDAAGGGASTDDASIEGTLVGGIVPHAGWIYSGGVAARVFAAL